MKAGYKGKVSVGPGYIHAPYIPKIMASWRTHLDYYSKQSILGLKTPNQKLHPEMTLVECATIEFQKRWPGPYVVEEYYSVEKGRIDMRLKFDDPAQETWWLLKWS